ncbi:MAG: PQQ-binding-like beta-propeller repeat protein, partial [Planctomycetes bacterium]|nr:PQQ-binding-like beta-propeller repeat protein [Planctomycetota bacterium]
LQKETGEILWSRVAFEGLPKVKRHIKGTHANCTPTTDGRFVVAFFGSQGLYCYDMEGELVWSKEFGLLDAGPPGYGDLQWGFASSPVIDKGRVYVQCDARNNSFVAALKLATGKEVWRTPREEDGTWSTPTVHKSRKRKQLIVNGYKHIGGYDLRNGKELWKLRGGGDIPVPTPIVSGNLIYITNAHGAKSPIYAIRTKAKGDITPTDRRKKKDGDIVWSIEKGGAYMQTPLVYEDLLYNCRDNGVLSVYDAKTGRRYYQQRLGGGGTGFTASPVAGDGKVYFTSEEGDVHVIKAGKTLELLATNSLGEICMSSAAISQGVMYYRTRHHVVALSGTGARAGEKD